MALLSGEILQTGSFPEMQDYKIKIWSGDSGEVKLLLRRKKFNLLCTVPQISHHMGPTLAAKPDVHWCLTCNDLKEWATVSH